MTSFLPGTNKDYVAAYNNWWFNGAKGPAPDRGKFGPDTNEYKKGKFKKDYPEEMGKGKATNNFDKGWLDFYKQQYQNSFGNSDQKIGGGEVTFGLGDRTAKSGITGGRPATPEISYGRPAKSKITGGRPASSSQLYNPNQKASDFGTYSPANFGGALYNQGWGNMVSWGNKFKDNETIQAGVSGARMDSNRTMMNMGLNLLYQRGQMSNMAEYQGGMENLRTGNTMKLMAAEGGIVNQLMKGAGDIESRQIGERGDQERRGLRVVGQEERAGIKTQGDQDRRGLRVRGDEERMGMMEQGSQNRMGMAAQGIEDRALTRTKGDQERKTQRDKYREERKMRADARGAVRRSGATFFG